LEFKVKPSHPAYTGTVAIQDATWTLNGKSAPARTTRTVPPAYAVPEKTDPPLSVVPAPIALDLESMLERDFADVYAACQAATQDVRELLPGGDFDELARHSPGLKGFRWDDYIRLSIIRMVRVARALRAHVRPGDRVLDLGSYFGNFALMARKLGFAVDAMDSYDRYAPALSRERQHLVRQGIHVLDTSGTEQPLAQRTETYAAALCLGVVEHIPHTPRELLKALHGALKPGGILVVDTPNLAYVYRREALFRGESVYPPLASQFDTELPFEGHHREFTQEELRYMLGRTGFEVIDFDVFNYSIYGVSEISGDDARRFLEMEREADKREVLFAVGRKV
jgi:2-polyprenyl-3-methyl-5-hydroxy-6-metoxy-1,4-benzoquinol methylase